MQQQYQKKTKKKTINSETGQQIKNNNNKFRNTRKS